MPDIWLLAIFAIPIIILIFLRVNAVFVYLALCLGYVVSLFDYHNKELTKLATTKVVKQFGGTNDIRLMMLLIPPLVITLFFLKTAHGKKFSILNLAPAIAVGLLLVITLVPLLPATTAVSIMGSSTWQSITKYQGGLVAISGVVIVILLILQRSKLSPSGKGSKHHKGKE